MVPIKSVVPTVAVALTVVALAGCASMVTGSTQKISISSEPAGATVIVDQQAIGQTPGLAEISRGKTHTVTVKKDGYQSQDFTLTQSMNGWVWGNIATAGLGSLVDLNTGAFYDNSPASIDAKLVATAPTEVAAAPPPPDLPPPPPPKPPAAPVPPAPVSPPAPTPSVAATLPLPPPIVQTPPSVAVAPEPEVLAPAVAAPASATVDSTPIPPPPALTDGTPSTTLRKPAVAALMMGTFKLHLGTTTLKEVKNAVGAGDMLQQGNGDKYRAWLCYTVSDGAMSQRIWLVSSALNGGVNVDGVDAVRLTSAPAASSACPELPAPLSSVRFDNGIWLWSTEATLLRNLGTPGLQDDKMWAYSYADEGPNYVVLQRFDTQIEKGKVVAIHVGRSLKSP